MPTDVAFCTSNGVGRNMDGHVETFAYHAPGGVAIAADPDGVRMTLAPPGSLRIGESPGRWLQPAARGNIMSTNHPVDPNDMTPGDESLVDGAGLSESVCPECEGHGVLKDRTECTNCGGTGRIANATGGA